MAVTLPGQVPFAPSRFSSSFDAQQNAALRKRMLQEALQQQALSVGDDPSFHTPGAKMSWTVPASKLASGLASVYVGKQADEAEQTSAQARQKQMMEWLNSVPTGTPAQDAVPGTPDIPAIAEGAPIAQEQGPPAMPPSLAERFSQAIKAPASPPPALTDAVLNSSPATAASGPFGPAPSIGGRFLPPPVDMAQLPRTGAASGGFLPKPLNIPSPGAAMPEGMSPHLRASAQDAVPGMPARAAVEAKQPTPQEMLAWSAQGSELGPMGQKISETVAADAMKSLLPKDPLMIVGSDLYDRGTGKFVQSPTTKAKLDETRISNIERNTNAGLQRDAVETRADADRQMRKQMADDRNAVLRAVHASTNTPAGTYKSDSVDAETGQPVMFNSKTGGRYTLDPETNRPVAYTGKATIPVATHEKNVTNAMAAENEAVMADKAAQLIEDNPGAYSPLARAGTALGVPTPYLGMNDVEQGARAYVGRDFAETTKRLYGAAFSASEQKRANAFTITALDDAKSAANKARAAAEFAREMAGKYGSTAALTAAQRMVGAPPAPAPATPAADKPAAGSWGNFKAH